VNKARQLISAIFNYGMRPSTYGLPANPAAYADRRRERRLRRPQAHPRSARPRVASARQVPLTDQAAAAIERLSRRGEFTGPDDYVFPNRLGRRLDPSALRRRFERARDATGLEH
jgi:hypothetical protein